MTTCSCEQPTASGCDPYTPEYGWHDPEGIYEGWTAKERYDEWWHQIVIIRKKTQERYKKEGKIL